MNKLAIVPFVAAAVGLVAAGYLYTFCVPLESACHLGDAETCARLARTVLLSKRAAIAAVALALCGGLMRALRRRADRLHSGTPRA